MIRPNLPRYRAGFTLVELLVAMALTIFIMAILAEAFGTGVDTLSRLKATARLQEKLRSATTLLRRDLRVDHFTPDVASADAAADFAGAAVLVTRASRRRVSDFDFSPQAGTGARQPPLDVAAGGFFRVWNGSPFAATTPAANVAEGADLDGIPSSRATDHALHFTINLAGTGNAVEDYCSWTLPASATPTDPGLAPLWAQPPTDFQDQAAKTVRGQWAEVVYFLSPNGGSALGAPLFNLCRRQRLVLTDPASLPTTPSQGWMVPAGSGLTAADFTDGVACGPHDSGSGLAFYSAHDLARPERRFGMDPAQTGGVFAGGGTAPAYATLSSGDDIVLGDVLSFEVKVLSPQSAAAITAAGGSPELFTDLFAFDAVRVPPGPTGTPVNNQNPNFFDAVGGPSRPRVFDTWTRGYPGVASPPAAADSAATQYGFNWNRPGSPFALPLSVRLTAMQVTLRVWDVRSEQTRQITVVQDL